ncbi:MAG: acyl carrier protein [Candidatus Sulfotelmatobacter sp.]|jgi:acyl carrier protein
MQTTSIHQEIRGFLVETFLFGRNDELTDDAPLLDTVIDSHGVVEFVVFLQDRFAIRVEDEDVNTNNLDSVNKTAAYVRSKLETHAAVSA